jgi:acyl-[acyl-carrier-protein] desaturase
VQVLKKICGMIAGDEARHERAYTKIIEELFRRDPDGAMLAFGDMMRKQIVMPAHLMDDLEHEGKNEGRNLFSDFSDVAQRLGIYTAEDYVSILEHLNMRWDVAGQTGLSGEAAKEQEFVLKLPDRIRKLSERALVRRQKLPKQDAKFSWIYDRPVPIA